ncbi:hypothetical protein [Bradyrhizobium yuanmingense]
MAVDEGTAGIKPQHEAAHVLMQPLFDFLGIDPMTAASTTTAILAPR